MKKVLLLGDSIRVGYGKYVRMAFEDEAEICYPGENCRFAAYTLRNLNVWKNENKWVDDFDLIHWNVGLWDCLELLDGQMLTELTVYATYLPRIHAVMKRFWPSARQIFATSTAVQEHLFGEMKRKNGNIEAFNQAAKDALIPLGVGINDLYALTKDFPESYYSDSTHFNTKEGQSRMVNHVIACIEKELDIKAKKLDFDQFFSKETNIVGI